MASTADPTRKIEALFRPSTRYRDLIRELPDHPEYDEVVKHDEYGYGSGDKYGGFTEVELLPHLSPEDIATKGTTWKDVSLFLGGYGRIVWMTPEVYVCPVCSHTQLFPWVLSLGGGVQVHVQEGTEAEVATATCDCLLRLLATREEDDIFLKGRYRRVRHNIMSLPITCAGLSRLFQESRDSLRTFTLENMTLNEDQCRALAIASRPTLEIALHNCSLPHGTDCENAFIECLQSDSGLIKLVRCRISCRVLSAGLTGNSRVTRLLLPHSWTQGDAGKSGFFRALASNRGLEYLNVNGNFIYDKNWAVLCESLQAHPALTNLDLSGTIPVPGRLTSRRILSDEQKAHRTGLLADMVRRNTTLHTITVSEREWDQQIYAQRVRPYLETNMYRSRVVAVKKTKEPSFREKVLGRALHSVKTNPNLVWMFLSENVDAFARSNEESNIIEVPVAVAAVVVAVAGIGRKRKRKR
jgi:hypothetical protein